MKLVCKIACLALLMNTLPGIGQERVFYKTVPWSQLWFQVYLKRALRPLFSEVAK